MEGSQSSPITERTEKKQHHWLLCHGRCGGPDDSPQSEFASSHPAFAKSFATAPRYLPCSRRYSAPQALSFGWPSPPLCRQVGQQRMEVRKRNTRREQGVVDIFVLGVVPRHRNVFKASEIGHISTRRRRSKVGSSVHSGKLRKALHRLPRQPGIVSRAHFTSLEATPSAWRSPHLVPSGVESTSSCPVNIQRI